MFPEPPFKEEILRRFEECLDLTGLPLRTGFLLGGTIGLVCEVSLLLVHASWIAMLAGLVIPWLVGWVVAMEVLERRVVQPRLTHSVHALCAWARERGLNSDALISYWDTWQPEFYRGGNAAPHPFADPNPVNSEGAARILRLIRSYDAEGWRGLKTGGLPVNGGNDAA